MRFCLSLDQASNASLHARDLMSAGAGRGRTVDLVPEIPSYPGQAFSARRGHPAVDRDYRRFYYGV